MRHSLIICLTPLLSLTSLAQAGEYTVEPKPFKIVTTLDAVFLPAHSQAIAIQPEKWTDFIVTQLVPHGTHVKKGDPLIGIDSRQLDQQIAAAEKARKADALTLDQAKHDLAQLEITTPRSLATSARKASEDQESLTWYTQIGHAIEIETSQRSIQSAERRLAYQIEELKQLKKMYGEDNKTEETEEIILTRTRNAVDHARFTLKTTQIEAAHTLKTTIPRKLKSHQRAAEDSRISHASAQKTLPRELAQKRIAVAKAIHDDKETAKNLLQMKADRAMMQITAPADGVIYYGKMKQGKWTPTTAVKSLKVGGKIPAHTTLMTFIPHKTPLVLSAFTEAPNLSALTRGANGSATTELNRYQSFPVSLTHINTYPETDGSFRATLKPNTSASLHVVPGMKATAKIISHAIKDALKIPTEYLTHTDDGTYTVNVKLADGKTTSRKVEIGRSNNDWVVITQGLVKDQVIVE
ncbi:MAG: biotin/lipoyl-binding protein [Verrucomicrobiae bacterium]|nr:biotin/lipoyl-binding protein [Verrucomicrobiae bacterium]NNJ41782.1 biotin/lipoyl-binding protein [Akkermansiaceae bacterium]